MIKSQILFVIIIFISGCSSLHEQVDKDANSIPDVLPKDIGNVEIHGTPEAIKRNKQNLLKTPTVSYSPLPKIVGDKVKIQKTNLPLIFDQEYYLDFGQGRVGIPIIVQRIREITGVPIQLNADVSTDVTIRMIWKNNTLRDFLDYFTKSADLSWRYIDGSIIISKFIPVDYSLYIIPVEQKYTFISSSEFSESGFIDQYTAILETLMSLVSSQEGSVVRLNPGSGVVTVITTASLHEKVADYLERENEKLSKQINITFDIFTITKNIVDTQGVNWSLVFQNLSESIITSIPSVSNVSVANATITTLDGKGANSKAILSALRSSGLTVSHRPVSLTTVSGHMKTQANTRTQAYVSQTTPGTASSSGAAGAPGLTTDTFDTGDSYSALPILLSNNDVLIKYLIRLSSLVALENFTSGVGDTQQTLQIPTTETITDTGNIRLKPGQAFMISGLSRITSSTNQQRLGEGISLLLGGSNNTTLNREYFLVLVSATGI